MTTTETNKSTKSNGGPAPKVSRPRKPLNARTAAMKIAELLEKLPADMRDRTLSLAKSLIEAEGH